MNSRVILSKHSRRSIVALVLIIVVGLAAPLFADGFGTNSTFGPPEEAHVFQAPETAATTDGVYFIHQQPLKIALLLVFTAVAAGIIVTRRYYLRK